MKYKNIDKEFLYCMFYDESSNKMYLGNVVKGLNIITLSNFFVSQKNIPYTGEIAYESLPFTKNSIITKGGIEYYKDKANKIYNSNLKYDKRFLIYDNSFNLLYLGFNKIYRRLKSSQFQKIDSVTFQNEIQGLWQVNKKYLISANNNPGSLLYVFPDDQFKKANYIFKFKESVSCIKKFNKDLIYVGTSNGIFLISLSRHAILKHLAKGLPIKEIQQTKDGNYWITTYNKGFYFFKNDKVIRLTDDRNGFINSAHHILEDKRGFFWLSSNNGLFRVSGKMLLDYAENKSSSVIYYRFTKENGFLNNEFNGSSNLSGNILENGEFVFPSMEGFVFFKPDEIKSFFPKKSQVFVERVRIDDSVIYFKDTLLLNSNFKNADILIDIPYYYNIDNIYLDVKLLGQNNSWMPIKKDRKYTLAEMNPGKYTLLVKFLTFDNVFAYKKIIIVIKPFFYQTLLFKIVVFSIFLGVIIFAIHIRTNYLWSNNKDLKDSLDNKDQELRNTRDKLKIEAENQQKIMESISHDITTPVRFLVSISQKLSEQENIGIHKEYFDEIYKTSKGLFKFTSGIKEYTELFKQEDFIESEEYSLHQLVEEKKMLFEHIAMRNNTELKNLCEPFLEIKVKKNILSAILHNLIDNSVKNTYVGEIVIKTNLKNEELEICILDTGKGMSQDQLEYYSQVYKNMGTENFIFKDYGLGLHMVIQLSKKICAKISFRNNLPEGTIVKLLLNMSDYE